MLDIARPQCGLRNFRERPSLSVRHDRVAALCYGHVQRLDGTFLFGETVTAGRPKDPRGRPCKHFQAIVEQFGKVKLMLVIAHDGEHAKELALKKLARFARRADGLHPGAVHGILVGKRVQLAA